MKKKKFKAEVLSGHKEDVVEVPFDPAKEWGASHQSLCDFIAHRSRFAAYSVTTECHYNACLYNLRNLWMG